MSYLFFEDHPEFTPNITPRDIYLLGSFGGTYWRPIYSHVTNKSYSNEHKKFNFLKDIDDHIMTLDYDNYDKNINRYKVRVGTTLEFWEKKGWITKYDPYGWVQWYCNFYNGRRCPDDSRQIKRWLNTAGPNSRFRLRLLNLIKEGKDSPAIRQTLQHWGVNVI